MKQEFLIVAIFKPWAKCHLSEGQIGVKSGSNRG